jgi:hypothetical protein
VFPIFANFETNQFRVLEGITVRVIPVYFHNVICVPRNICFILLICGLSFNSGHAQTAKVQFIHNSQDDSLYIVDVWVGEILWANDLNIHQATPLQQVTDSALWTIRHAEDSSIIYYSLLGQLAPTSKNIFTLQGQLTDQSNSPFRPLGIHQFSQALEQSGSTSSIEVLFLHGTSDLDSIEIQETQLFQLTAFNNVEYGEYTNYLPLFTADYGWSVLRESDSSLIAEFSLPINELSWAGRAITIVTSGFVNQSNNNYGESFGMWATTSAGGALVPLETLRWNITSDVQFMNTASLPGAENIQITIDGENWHNQLNVHHATPFIPFPSGKEIVVCVNSVLGNGQLDSLWCDTIQLLSGQDYQLIWFGGESTSALPQLYINEWELSELISLDSIDLILFNATSGWPNLSLRSNNLEQTSIFENVSYAQLSSTARLAGVSEEWILYSETDSITALYAPFDILNFNQQQITALTFPDTVLNIPSVWLCSPSGGPMIRLNAPVMPEIPIYCDIQFIHTSADTSLSTVDVWLNDSLLISSLSFESASNSFTIPCSDTLSIRLTAAGDSSLTLLQNDFLFEPNQLHRLFLWGIFHTQHYNPAPPLTWHHESNVSSSSIGENEIELRIFHAATDLGTVDLDETTLPIQPLFSNVDAGELSESASISSGNNLVFSLRNSPTQFLFASYTLPAALPDFAGQSITLLSSGFRQPANNSNGSPLKMWALFPNSSMNELSPFVGIERLDNTNSLSLFPNPCSTFTQLRGAFKTDESISIQLVDISGRILSSHQTRAANGMVNEIISVKDLPEGLYHTIILSEQENYTISFIKE